MAFLAFGPLFFAAPAMADDLVAPGITVVETPGGDDTSYQIPLTTTVSFDGVVYDSVYATTNSVITFGQPDGTYWDYPMTPSISLYSMDWVVFPNRGDEHLVIQSSNGGFQIDISARPYGMWNYQTFDPTNIVITAAINTDGTVAISYSTSGPTYDWSRTGVRLTDGSVVTLEAYGIVQVEEAPVLTPEPVVPVEPTPEPTPEPSPEPSVPPAPEPEPTPVQPAPQPEVVPLPQPQPAPQPEPVPTVAPAPEPEAAPEPAPMPPEPVVEPVAPEPPIVEPEPILPQTKAEVVAELAAAAQADDPQLDPALAAIPLLGDALGAALEVFNDIGNLGSDMTPEVREQAEKTVVASVIVGQVASSAAAAAATSASASTRKNK